MKTEREMKTGSDFNVKHRWYSQGRAFHQYGVDETQTVLHWKSGRVEVEAKKRNAKAFTIEHALQTFKTST